MIEKLLTKWVRPRCDNLIWSRELTIDFTGWPPGVIIPHHWMFCFWWRIGRMFSSVERLLCRMKGPDLSRTPNSYALNYLTAYQYQYVGNNTFSFFRQKSIYMAVVTEQTTETFDWKLIGFTYRGRIHWNCSHSKSMVYTILAQCRITFKSSMRDKCGIRSVHLYAFNNTERTIYYTFSYWTAIRECRMLTASEWTRHRGEIVSHRLKSFVAWDDKIDHR